MKKLKLFAVSVAFALSLLATAARAQGDDVAFDFRMTDSGTTAGRHTEGVGTGRAIVSKGRVRLELKGNVRAMAVPGANPGDDVSIIMQDTGKAITILQPKAKQYMRFNPAEMVDRMQKMMEGMGASISVDGSGPEPKLDNLGAGPVILGHKTVHYRVTTALKLKINAMGQSQAMEMSSITDEYLAPDLGNLGDPFRGMKSADMTGVFGPGSQAFVEKVRGVMDKLPKATELRAETQLTISGAGQTSNVKSVREITAIHRLTAARDLFEIPSDYKQIALPMGGTGNGAIPPGA